MSGAAGGSRIKKEDLKATIRDYRDNVLKPLGLDKSYTITGVRSRPEKDIFGDIDVVVSFPGGDKKELKQTLAKFIEQINKVPEIPQKKNKKYFIHGSIVSILYPIYGKENEYVQIDNIVTASKEEGKFTYKMLDLPAQEQGLALGLVKAIFTELDQNQIDKLFKDLKITDIEKPGEGEEYDFNLNPSELSLKIVKKGTSEGKTVWTSSSFSDIKTLLSALGIDIEKDKFDTIVSKIKKFKNRRSIDRLKGMYAKNIRVGDAEVGLEKGIKKQQSLDTVNALQEKYNALVLKMINPLLTEEKNSTIAVFPGKFKPPHKDHLARINAASKAADKVLVIIGPKPVDSFTAEQTLDLFNLFKSKGLVPNNVEFVISDLPSPVLKAYKEFEDNPNQQYIAVFGKDDIARFKNIDKLPNVKVDNFEEANVGNLSATDLRNAILNKDIPTIKSMMPDGVNAKEYIQTLANQKIQEEVTDTEVICDNCGWHWPIADGGDDLYICHKCGHDNTPTLNEVGEGSAAPFAWKPKGNLTSFINKLKKIAPESDRFVYEFSSDKDKYMATAYVHMFKLDKGYDVDVSFGFNIINDETDAVTNYQEQYRVLATVMQIIIDFVNNVNSMKNVVVSQVKISPKSDDPNRSFSSDINSKRGKFYKAYIEKNLSKLNKNYDLNNTSSTFILQLDDSSLNENQNQTWDLQKGIVSLSEYMLDKGLNIKPLPKVKFIDNDEENASNMLGKTAYYNPSEKSITLYTFGRHPKDILRSFSHEMIHHMQNLENRLNNINTTNTNEDGDLPEMEREAYEKGNMMLRNWEDSIKNV